MKMKQLLTTRTRVLFILLSAILMLATPVYAQNDVEEKQNTTTLSEAEKELLKSKYVEYDQDVYARYKLMSGYVMPSNYYLKSGEQYIEIQQDELDGYLYEEADGQYYVYGLDDKKYLLSFKPEIADIIDKDQAYFKKCEEIKKDYIAHPEKYKDVTIIDNNTKESTGSYIDCEGYEWVLESEMHGFYLLEGQNVYVLLDELRFIQLKE